MVTGPSLRLPRTEVIVPSSEATPSKLVKASATERPAVVRMFSPDSRAMAGVISMLNTGGSHATTTSLSSFEVVLS